MYLVLGVACPEIIAPTNGHLLTTMDTFRFEDMASFVCDIGYVMKGKKEITCTSRGSWSDAVPTCEGKHVIIIIYKFSEAPGKLQFLVKKNLFTEHAFLERIVTINILQYANDD